MGVRINTIKGKITGKGKETKTGDKSNKELMELTNG